MLMDKWQRQNYEKIISSASNVDYCPICHRCVPYYDIHQYIMKNSKVTESCLKMCYECFNNEVRRIRSEENTDWSGLQGD